MASEAGKAIGGLRPWLNHGGSSGWNTTNKRVPSALRLWSCWRPRSLPPRAEQVLYVNFQHGGTQLAVTASGHSEAGVCHKKSPGVWEDGATIGEQLQQVPYNG